MLMGTPIPSLGNERPYSSSVQRYSSHDKSSGSLIDLNPLRLLSIFLKQRSARFRIANCPTSSGLRIWFPNSSTNAAVIGSLRWQLLKKYNSLFIAMEKSSGDWKSPFLRYGFCRLSTTLTAGLFILYGEDSVLKGQLGIRSVLPEELLAANVEL